MSKPNKLVGRSAKCCPHCGKSLNPTYMTEDEQREAIERRRNGETLYGLSVRFNREYSTIRRLMQRNGIKINAKKANTSNRQSTASSSEAIVADIKR